MPAIDDPFGVAASLPGQVAKLRMDIKDLAANNTQAASLAASSATAAAASANAAAASATSAASAATAAQISPAVGNGSAAGFTLTLSYATLVVFGIPVPSGYTRALVIASAFIGSISASTTGDRIYMQTVINSVAGPESTVVLSAASPVGCASAFETQSLSGLSAGGTISISVQAHLQVGPGSSAYSNATASAMVIFQV